MIYNLVHYSSNDINYKEFLFSNLKSLGEYV